MLYSAHELKLEISLVGDADPHALVRNVDQTIRYHGFRRVDGAHGDSDLSIHIRVGHTTESVPDSADLLRTHETGIRMLRSNEYMYLTRDADVMCVRADSGELRIFITPDAIQEAANVNSTLYLFLTFGLVLLLQSRDLFVLHAAALESPDGEGFLIVAPSGSGNSTLSMRLVESGWKFVSDDSVVIGRSDERITVRPFRRDAAVFAEAISAYPRAAKFSETLFSDPSKVLVDMSQAYPHQRIESLSPDAIIFPSLTGQPVSSIARMETAEAMVALIEQASFLAAAKSFVSRQMAILNELLQEAALLNLRAGLDLKDHPEAAANLLARIDIEEPHPPSAT